MREFCALRAPRNIVESLADDPERQCDAPKLQRETHQAVAGLHHRPVVHDRNPPIRCEARGPCRVRGIVSFGQSSQERGSAGFGVPFDHGSVTLMNEFVHAWTQGRNIAVHTKHTTEPYGLIPDNVFRRMKPIKDLVVGAVAHEEPHCV
jgi:hypothetical protein